MAIERLSVILEMITGNYKREAREAATATGQIGAAAKTSSGLMTGALLTAGVAIVKFGADSVRAASNLEESMNAVNVVFGEAAGTITDFGETAADAAGLAQAEFQQMATVLGSALINAGLPLDEAAEKTIELTQRAADMASVFNTSVPEALGAMQAALRGESDPIEKFGVTLSAAAVDAEAAALGFKKVGGEWDAQAKAAARLSLIMKQTSRVQGDFANTSDGLANKTRQLQASMTNLQAQIGGYLIPALAGLADEGLDATNVISGMLGVIDHATAAISGNADAASVATEEFDKYSSLLDILIPGITASLQPWSELNAVLDENAIATKTASEAHDSWMTVSHDFIPIIGNTIALLDRQATSHRNVATAATTQRTALINLFNAQADLLDPIGNVLRLQKENAEAQKRLTEAQNDGETSAEDLAIATIEAEQAFLRLQGAGAALTPDQIQAFAQLLITEFGYSEKAALDLLDTLNLLDGWQGRATFTLEAVGIAAGTSGIRGTGNINSLFDQFGFASGGIVPGPRGSQQVVLAHGGETILPTHRGGMVGGNTTIVVQSPMNDFRSDMQYATILASVTNLVEAG